MNGYRVQIFEQDTRPGGLCTSWERKGYTINGGLAFLGGSGSGTHLYRLWQELGVVPRIKMIDYEYFVIVEGEGEEKFFMHTDLNRLEQHMKGLAPEDGKVIDDFIRAIRIFTKYQLPFEKAQELYTAIDKMKLMFTHLPLFRAIKKWKKVSIQEYVQRFKNPFLRNAFYAIKASFSDDLPLVVLHLFCAWSHLKSAGYPEGGSFEFARTIERHFLDLGGRVIYKARADKILVENNKAVGIRLEDGSEHYSDHVISAADGRTTLFGMLDRRYVDKKIRGYYETLPLGTPVVLVALGISRQFADLPHSGIGIIYPLKEPATIGGKEFRQLRPMIYNFDPTLAPEGKTLLRVVLQADYDYWKRLHEEGSRYTEEKDRVAEIVINLLEQRFAGISSEVEMRDVATPVTFERYTGNWQGAYEGWLITTKTLRINMKKTLPGLDNFYMIGQWVVPGGGLPTSVMTGRHVMQIICKRDGKKFVTTLPHRMS